MPWKTSLLRSFLVFPSCCKEHLSPPVLIPIVCVSQSGAQSWSQNNHLSKRAGKQPQESSIILKQAAVCFVLDSIVNAIAIHIHTKTIHSGLERLLSSYKPWLLFQKARVGVLAPSSGSSQLPATLLPGESNTSGLQVHSLHTWTHMDMQMHTIKNMRTLKK